MINKALIEVAKEGSSFLYNLDDLQKHAISIQNGAAKIFFACKANPLTSILKTLDKANISFDVASEGELTQVLSLGIKGSKIIMTGPAKPKSLIKLGLENKISTFVIESPLQLEILESMVKNYDYKPNILLRLQLIWKTEEQNILGGQNITSLGMDVETAKDLLSKTTLKCLGFHVFQWGNILSVDKFREIWEYTIKVCKSITKDFEVLDVGGGLGVVYDNNHNPIKWDDINNLIQELKVKYKVPQFWLELGRYMTAQCGYYITHIVDIKNTYGKNIVVLEGGINHLTRPALVSQAFPVSYMSSNIEYYNDNVSLEKFSLYGPLCTSLDCMGEHKLPKNIKVGDYIIFNKVGAYGFTESMPFFLCHKLPGEAVIQNQKLHIIRKPKNASCWLK